MDLKVLGVILLVVIVISFFIFWIKYQNKILRDPDKVLKNVEIYINEQLYNQAKADLKRAIKVNPDNVKLKEKLRELEN